jgi:hypothetical protein
MAMIAIAIMTSINVKPPQYRTASRDQHLLGIACSFSRPNNTFALPCARVNYVSARGGAATNGVAHPTSGTGREEPRRVLRCFAMTTKLAGPLKREIVVNGAAYTVTITDEGLKLVPKGRRKGYELDWASLVSGEAALAAALNASLASAPPEARPALPKKRAQKRSR